MIDGSGREWVSKIAGDQVNMPNPNGGFYPTSQGHPGNGFIRITILQSHYCKTVISAKLYYLSLLLFVMLIQK